MAVHTFTIPNFIPTRLNQFTDKHWSVRSKLKAIDREMIGCYSKKAKIPPATSKRRVILTITLGPRMRGGDVDAFWKSVLDSLVHAGLLIDDNKENCEIAPVIYQRASVKSTTITLEDLDGGTQPRKRKKRQPKNPSRSARSKKKIPSSLLLSRLKKQE